MLIAAKICLEERHSLHLDCAASCAGLHPHNPTEVNGVDIEFRVGFHQVFLIQMFQLVHQIFWVICLWEVHERVIGQAGVFH